MQKNSSFKHLALDVLKGTFLSLIVGVILVLVFAIIVKFVPIGANVLVGINQAIKVISIFLGCTLGFKMKKGGILKGAIVGILYSVFIILIFGLIEKSLTFNVSSLIDVGLGLVLGAISGIIAVNVGKNKKTA